MFWGGGAPGIKQGGWGRQPPREGGGGVGAGGGRGGGGENGPPRIKWGSGVRQVEPPE